MTPVEKARELYNKFWDLNFSETDFRNTLAIDSTKQNVLLFVNEVLNETMLWNAIDGERRIFWNKVKEAIKKL